MTRESILALGILAAVVLAAGALMLREKYRQRQWFLKKIRGLWGSVSEREYTPQELESISHYARNHQNGRFMVDDITWNDLNMNQLFAVLNTTVSSCGEDVLYSFLRIPETDGEILKERNRLITYFQEHQKEREELQILLDEVRKMVGISISDYIYALRNVERKSLVKYILMACLTAASIGTIFIQPMTGVIVLLMVVSFNGIVHMQDSKKIEPYLNCFICIMRLLKAADGFEKVENPQIQDQLDRIREGRRKMKGFRRGAFFVAANGAMQDGLEAFVISYLKIMFQVDMIKFYSAVKQLEGHEKDIDDMYTAMGELDACIAIASFREYVPYYCQPELNPWTEGTHAELEMKDLYHPLIPNPVANSIQMKLGVLVTGSNASGKSTFLKTIAVNVLLAQSIFTCVSHSYRGNFMKVMTSMALRDNLEGGESYYIVEIKSLQRILKECQKGEPVLCIVDEVLRGTNTIERIAASSRILRSLAQPHILPLAATHDIELSYILEDCYTNYHFEEEIRDHDVLFNYMLMPGRATTRNAIKLLEIIGYDPAIIHDAQEAAKRFEETGVWK